MKLTIEILSLTFLLVILSMTSQAKEWHGIVPFRSTRADVSRILGKCSKPRSDCSFESKEGQVRIAFNPNASYYVCASRI